MNTEAVEEAMDNYLQDRKTMEKEKAAKRFLANVRLKHSDDEMLEFLSKVRGLAEYQIDFLKMMKNPFKGPELAWFASMVAVGSYGSYLIYRKDSRVLGFLLFAGALVNAWSLIRRTVRKRSKVGEAIVIYLEIVQIVENELQQD